MPLTDWPGVAFFAPLAVIALIFAVALVVMLGWGRGRFDRKKQFQRDPSASPPWTGIATRTFPVHIGLAQDAALDIAQIAIANLGGRDIARAENVVTGWTGTMWTNYADWQAYQLAVVVRDSVVGSELLCCARPRKAWTLWGPLALNFSVSREKTEDLAAEVERLAELHASGLT